MRQGTNPNKTLNKLLKKYRHRVFIPFYIPESENDFYKGVLETFELFLFSLSKTIDTNQTVVTLVNNNSRIEAAKIAEKYVKLGLIGEYITLNENRGKVDTFLRIAKSCNEQVITLCDADMLLFDGWEKAVFDTFSKVPKAGVVAPFVSPHLSMDYATANTVVSLFFKNKIRFGKVIPDEHFYNMFSGFGKTKEQIKKNKLFKKQFYTTKNKDIFLFGASHNIISFRKEVLYAKTFREYIPEVFYEGIEYFNIDTKVDRLGYYRISSKESYVYHLGNNIPNNIKSFIPDGRYIVPEIPILKPPKKSVFRFLPEKVRIILFQLIKKMYYKRHKL